MYIVLYLVYIVECTLYRVMGVWMLATTLHIIPHTLRTQTDRVGLMQGRGGGGTLKMSFYRMFLISISSIVLGNVYLVKTVSNCVNKQMYLNSIQLLSISCIPNISFFETMIEII